MTIFLDFWVDFFKKFTSMLSSLSFGEISVLSVILAVLVITLLISYIFKVRW